jgi:glycosyltransferase involved in cell wall biosynthesis
MKISYAILTHNEGEYIEKLIKMLTDHKRAEDEIVVVDDYSTCELTRAILAEWHALGEIKLYYREFDGDHTQKNYLNSLCTGDYIMQLDADECLYPQLIELLPSFLQDNSDVDLFYVPRINTVDGLTQEWTEKWQWNVNERGWVNFPDWQMRLYRNCDYVKWDGLLHSKVVGFKTYAFLPPDELYCILHPKDITRQIAQNELYDKIEANGRTKYKV